MEWLRARLAARKAIDNTPRYRYSAADRIFQRIRSYGFPWTLSVLLR